MSAFTLAKHNLWDCDW